MVLFPFQDLNALSIRLKLHASKPFSEESLSQTQVVEISAEKFRVFVNGAFSLAILSHMCFMKLHDMYVCVCVCVCVCV